MVQHASNGKKPTIHDIAQLAGTSASSVSAVLNGNWKKRRISQNLADRITQIADAQGYALNMQASALRKARSGIIGMILPLHDNRYFSSIAQVFEEMARARGLFPIVTCTQRDPKLELEAARALLAYQVEYLVCTGATNPDHITRLCNAAGVPTINLDLPGKLAPSVISDNFQGAYDLTRDLIRRTNSEGPLMFVGGRRDDHNTQARLRGFREALRDAGLAVAQGDVLDGCGYAASRTQAALQARLTTGADLPKGIFVNSTISLEGVMRWLRSRDASESDAIKLACFDWDPFAEMLADGIVMIRQDVDAMVTRLFNLIDKGDREIRVIEIPTISLKRTPQ